MNRMGEKEEVLIKVYMDFINEFIASGGIRFGSEEAQYNGDNSKIIKAIQAFKTDSTPEGLDNEYYSDIIDEAENRLDDYLRMLIEQGTDPESREIKARLGENRHL